MFGDQEFHSLVNISQDGPGIIIRGGPNVYEKLEERPLLSYFKYRELIC